jgi:hypothetical protein
MNQVLEIGLAKLQKSGEAAPLRQSREMNLAGKAGITALFRRI